MNELDKLIEEAEQWRAEHKAAGRKIEAMAVAVRLKALRDARKCFDRS